MPPLSNPWTDPHTGAVVTETERTITITLDGRSSSYIKDRWIRADHLHIVDRWKAARDE